jgi:hypothetical protein
MMKFRLLGLLVLLISACGCTGPSTGTAGEGEGEDRGEGDAEAVEQIQEAYRGFLLAYITRVVDCFPFLAEVDGREALIERFLVIPEGVVPNGGYPGEEVSSDDFLACGERFAMVRCEHLSFAPNTVCADLLNGTQPDGGDCLVGGQCQSGQCNNFSGDGEGEPASSCGSCSERFEADCDNDDDCSGGQQCELGVCRTLLTLPSSGDGCAPDDDCNTNISGLFCDNNQCAQIDIAEAGETCGIGFVCRGSYVGTVFCDDQQRCTPFGDIGDDCTDYSCLSALECRNGRCAAPPTEGQPCTSRCADQLVCSNNTCMPPPGPGENCMQSCASGFACEGGVCLSYSDAFAAACPS